MRIHTLVRPLVAAVLTMTALGVAACGGDGGSGGESAASRDKQIRDAQLDFARCMREHGIDVPDPEPGSRGMRLNARGVSPQKMRAADEACRQYLEDVPAPEISEEQKKEFQEAALAHARCMREHGIDFPDPTFDENGGAQIRLRKGSGVDPDSAKFQEAQKACESKMPKLGGEGPSTTEAKP